MRDPLNLLASDGEAKTCYLYQNELLSEDARESIVDGVIISSYLNNALRKQYLETILKKINPEDQNVILVDQIDGLFWSTKQPARLLDGVKQLPSIKRGELQVNIERRKLQVNQGGKTDFSDTLSDESAATARRTHSSIGVLMGVTCGLSCAGVGLLAIGIVSAFCPPVAIAVMCSWQGVVSASVGSIVLGAMLGFGYDILNANKTPKQDATQSNLNNPRFPNGDYVRLY